MAPIPVIAPTIVRVSLHHNLANGRHADCVLDVSLDEGLDADRPESVANMALALGQLWQDTICTEIHAPCTYTGGSYTDLDSLDSTTGSFGAVPGHPVNNPSPAETPPPQVALLVTKVCHHARNQRNGRLYMPGLREDFTSSTGDIGGSYLTGIQSKFDALLAGVNDAGGLGDSGTTALRVVHVTGHEATSDGSVGRPNAWSSSDVLNFVVNTRVATQRRRNRG